MALKNLIFKQKPEAAPQPTIVQQQSAPIQTQYISNSSSEDFNNFLAQLEEALDAANMPNTQDYMDLRTALKNMSEISIDEPSKYKAAFATLQAAGCDLKELLNSFDYYENVLTTEEHKFNEAVEASASDSVGKDQKELNRLMKENSDKSAQIQQLTNEINENTQKINTLQVSVSNGSAKVNQKKGDFEAALKKVQDELESDKKKVETYIGTMPIQQTVTKSKKSSKK